ncbi:MAG TPA: hypothetical protein VEU51_03100 [Candidatus Acidoferrales bacterium]|nr:hypothetical protein [Candidatus Acidoferrales bacterium]
MIRPSASRGALYCCAVLATVGAAIALTACSAVKVPTVPPSVTNLLKLEPNLTSFLDVRFGDSLYRVQTRFPSGVMQTAPSGADIYRIDKIEVDSIHYTQVDYEFTSQMGMQLVVARFTPESAGQVLAKLVQAVGPPTQQTNPNGSDPAGARASWQLAHGERVIFDGPRRFVAVIGPGGGSLKLDIEVREANDTL